ncbi:MAG TPA: nuclear transport factor 2 family protein [Solirubrobacterales bacterium]|nr:nuclear transport factor 2 family protein [Solirubrobacterales bacterium]
MADDEQQNVRLVRGGLENWIAGDHEAVIATFTDDVKVVVPPEVGNAGSYTGIEGFRRWFAQWDEAWSAFRMELKDIEPAGDRHVIAMVHSHGTGVGSGIEVGNVLAWVIGVRGDRMDFISLQPDRERASELVREREGSEGS